MFKYEMLSKVLNKENNGVHAVIGTITNGNTIILNNNRLEIISGKTAQFLAYTNIKELIKYENRINFYITNVFLYYLLNIKEINAYNGAIEENNGY